MLLKCIEEVTQKALAARAERKQLQVRAGLLGVCQVLLLASPLHWSCDHARGPKQLQPTCLLLTCACCLPHSPPLQDKLSQLQSQVAAPQPAAAGPSSAACTPPAAQRAAALERDLRQLEAASPTRLLLPHWPCSGDGAAAAVSAPAAMLYHPRPHLPTSAELRRQLQEAVAGGLGSGGGGGGGSGDSSGHNSAGSSGEKKAADREHHLHPSPPRLHSMLLEPAAAAAAGLQQQVQPHAALLQLRQEGHGLLRSCSAPGGLLAGAAAAVSMVDGSGAPMLDWFRGVAA